MKAVVYRRFGPPDMLRYEEVAKPVPGEEEVLVAVRAASVNPLDWHMLRGTPRLIRSSTDMRRKKIVHAGRDVAGVVEAVGGKVTRFRPGDAVFGACQGAFADYVCGKESEFTTKPSSLSFEEAAATPIAGLTALQALRDCGCLQAGHRVLINGASGGVGSFAVQLARRDGAQVTAICSAEAAPLVRGLGADRVIDYAREDVTGGAERFDLILDLIGNHSFRSLKRILADEGRIVLAGGGGSGGRRLGRWLLRAFFAQFASRFSRRKFGVCMSALKLDDLAALGEMIAAGEIRPVIAARYRLRDTAEAMRVIAGGHARGKIVITPDA